MDEGQHSNLQSMVKHSRNKRNKFEHDFVYDQITPESILKGSKARVKQNYVHPEQEHWNGTNDS